MNNKRGFTLVEILIVVVLLLVLFMVVFLNLRGQSARANDVKRKTDLYTLRKAFEEYNNDKNAFPVSTIVNTCNGTELLPYLAKIPCDPVTKSPYGYFPAANGGYRICTKLQDTTDPAIAAMGCGGPAGCGVGGGYNYCLSSGVTASAVGTVDEIITEPTATPTVTPSPTPMPPAYACAPPNAQGISICNHYAHPSDAGCPKSYLQSDCNNECGNPAVWCQL